MLDCCSCHRRSKRNMVFFLEVFGCDTNHVRSSFIDWLCTINNMKMVTLCSLVISSNNSSLELHKAINDILREWHIHASLIPFEWITSDRTFCRYINWKLEVECKIRLWEEGLVNTALIFHIESTSIATGQVPYTYSDHRGLPVPAASFPFDLSNISLHKISSEDEIKNNCRTMRISLLDFFSEWLDQKIRIPFSMVTEEPISGLEEFLKNNKLCGFTGSITSLNDDACAWTLRSRKNVATGSLLATAFVLVFLRAICLIKKGTNKD